MEFSQKLTIRSQRDHIFIAKSEIVTRRPQRGRTIQDLIYRGLISILSILIARIVFGKCVLGLMGFNG